MHLPLQMDISYIFCFPFLFFLSSPLWCHSIPLSTHQQAVSHRTFPRITPGPRGEEKATLASLLLRTSASRVPGGKQDANSHVDGILPCPYCTNVFLSRADPGSCFLGPGAQKYRYVASTASPRQRRGRGLCICNLFISPAFGLK